MTPLMTAAAEQTSCNPLVEKAQRAFSTVCRRPELCSGLRFISSTFVFLVCFFIALAFALRQGVMPVVFMVFYTLRAFTVPYALCLFAGA